MLLSVVLLLIKETICLIICSKSRLKSAKSPLPVDVRRSWRRSKTSPLKVLLKIMTENGIYSHLMKVVSNTFLFVYSSCAPSSKLRAGITRDGAIISIETPHYWKRSEGI